MKSVEVGHLLATEVVGLEHQEAILRAKEIVGEKTYCLLVDNYNFSSEASTLDLLKKFNDYEVSLQVVMYEKTLTQIAEQNLSRLAVNCEERDTEIKLKDSLIVLKSKGKFTCAYLTAMWYLVRLNKLDLGLPEATSLVNILPKRYEKNEQKVKKILQVINPEVLTNISWQFY